MNLLNAIMSLILLLFLFFITQVYINISAKCFICEDDFNSQCRRLSAVSVVSHDTYFNRCNWTSRLQTSFCDHYLRFSDASKRLGHELGDLISTVACNNKMYLFYHLYRNLQQFNERMQSKTQLDEFYCMRGLHTCICVNTTTEFLEEALLHWIDSCELLLHLLQGNEIVGGCRLMHLLHQGRNIRGAHNPCLPWLLTI